MSNNSEQMPMDIAMNPVEQPSQRETSGGKGMDINTRVMENGKTFRHNSLALVMYPWASGVVMQPDLSNVFDQDHFAFVSSATNPVCIQIHYFSSVLQWL